MYCLMLENTFLADSLWGRFMRGKSRGFVLWCKYVQNPEWDLASGQSVQTANAKVATVLGSIPASSDTGDSEGRQMKQCWTKYIKIYIKMSGI